MNLSDENLIKQFVKHQDDRKKLLDSLDAARISELIIKHASKSDFSLILWSSSLSHFKDEKQLFQIIKLVLPKLNRDQLSLRLFQDFISRFTIELHKKSSRFVLKTALLCSEFLELGDIRAIFYKDVLPVCLKILQRDGTKILNHEDASKSGKEYRLEIINSILKNIGNNVAILTNLVSMFKDIEITQAQQEILITKVCQSINKVSHGDIGNLALVTFQKSHYNQIILPLLAIDKYFYKRRYRFELNEQDSSPDSIEETSEEEGLIQAEENVIYHFQNISEYTTMEKHITNALKSLEYTPQFILSPFLSTILVSIAKISSSVQGNFRLNTSTILPFMKQIFKFNEEHRHIMKTYGWAKTIDTNEAVNTDALLKMLKQNTCNLKQDVALNGFFGLAFLLLKTKASPALNKFAIDFLNDIIKNRSEFTSDIMHIIVKMLFCERNKAPIIECFSSFVHNRHLDINASESALRKLIEDLTELDVNTALAIESVIFTAISKSINLRDLMIEIMKKAMYQRNVEVRKMAIFSFCVMLRKFTKPSRLSTQSRFSHNISMFSLTQSQIAITNATSNKNIRHVEIMMLEILGLLRKCFSENSEIKVMLYESLLYSIAANSFIIINVFEFLDAHFRMYFDCENDVLMNFDKLFNQSDNNDLIVMDDLGELLKFMISCIILVKENNEKLNCNTNVYEKILSKLIEKTLNATVEQLHVFSGIDSKNCVILSQFLTCCESLMVYCYWQIKYNDDNISKIIMLFEKHQEILKKAKKMVDNSNKKSDKKVTAKKTMKSEINTKSILNLKDCAAFLEALFSENLNEKMNELKQNKDFCQFILVTTSQKLKDFETATEHSKMKHSRSFFDAYLSCSKHFYQQLNPETFKAMHNNYSAECASSLTDAFKCLIYVMESVFIGQNDKWLQLLKAMTNKVVDDNMDDMLLEVIQRVHKNVEWMFEQEKKGDEIIATTSGTSILNNLFIMLQVLHTKLDVVSTKSQECFNWILSFCKRTSVKQKPLAHMIIKLFMQSIHQHENALLIDCVAHKIAMCYGYCRTMIEPESASQNNFAIISKQTVDDAFTEFIEFIKQQIFVIEVYIKRANSFNAHACLKGQDSFNDTCSTLESLEIAICTKLISLGKSMERVLSCKFPVSTRNIEKIIGSAKLYYNCLANLMKHFRKHHDIKHINYQCIGIEELIKYSKKFATCVYGIAPYIENMAEEESTKGKKDEAKNRIKKRDAILNKETKAIPRMIFLIEIFNSCVAHFDTAAKMNFTNYLHPGEVRDFHIKNSTLSNAIMRSQISARSQTFDDHDDDEDTNESAFNENSSDSENVFPPKKNQKRKRLQSESSPSSSSEDDEENDDAELSSESLHESFNVPLTRERFERNVRILTGKGKSTSNNGRKKK